MSKKELKVGDVVEHWGFNFSPLKWYEKMISRLFTSMGKESKKDLNYSGSTSEICGIDK